MGSWVKRQRKRFGLWLCKNWGHKNKRVVSVDWASRGSMIAEADVCQRCGLISVLDVREKPVKVITDMTFEGVGLMPDGTVQPRIRGDRYAPTALEIKSAEELVEGFYDARKNRTSREADPKADMTVVIKNCLPMHRSCIIEGFDPDHVVWTEEERKEMMEAPIYGGCTKCGSMKIPIVTVEDVRGSQPYPAKSTCPDCGYQGGV